MARLRAQRGLTFDRLAEQLGRRRPNVIVYEKGAVAPTPSMLVQLAAALGVQPCELTTATPATAELADLRVRAGKTNRGGCGGGWPTQINRGEDRERTAASGGDRAALMARALDAERTWWISASVSGWTWSSGSTSTSTFRHSSSHAASAPAGFTGPVRATHRTR